MMNKITLTDLCKNHSFWSLMKLTQKYKEFKFVESKFSIFFLFIILIYFKLLNSELMVITILQNIIVLITPVLIGIIGFIFTGLALMSTIITHKVLSQIDKEEKTASVAGILFSFYFCSGIIVSAVICGSIFLALTYEDFYTWFECGRCIMWFSLVLTIYFHIFSLFYSVSLLGTCLKFFFVNVYYLNKCENKIE